MAVIRTETETVIKRILPYLFRRGYELDDLDFETAVKLPTRYKQGYVDILVTCKKQKPQFLIEAKRVSKKLTAADRDQAIGYAQALNVLFVIVTNGIDIQCFNTTTQQPIRWNGKLIEKIPTRSQLGHVLQILKTDNTLTNIQLSADSSLPYRPGLALRQLNSLFSRIHNTIRKIEKDEEYAFADFSKLLFLKLLEEKADTTNFTLPYSYRFYELAQKPLAEADQIQNAIQKMRDQIIKKTPYGDVLEDEIHLRNPKTFAKIVKELSAVSFYDSGLDSKGAAFEYFVRATLKGKKLGQYFTPRNLVRISGALVGREKVLNQLINGRDELKVLDPACGTGGFLVHLMQDSIALLEDKYKQRKISKHTRDDLQERLMRKVFFGSDANPGVACAAKMNMIIAGDGHTNIQCEDSLAASAANWDIHQPNCDYIFTNPPFGTSESESLEAGDLNDYPIRTTKGQSLFLQKMVLTTRPDGEICTIIDEGVLNTDSNAELRLWLLKNCRLLAVVRLPDETFKPNKINVRSSILYFQRLSEPDEDGELSYKTTFVDLHSLGYDGSGESIRGFNFPKLLADAESKWLASKSPGLRKGVHWQASSVDISTIRKDPSRRFDFKFWEPSIRKRISLLRRSGGKTIRELNLIPTARGASPDASSYVDEKDGFAIVIKAGSNISKFGTLVLQDADWIEKSLYDEYCQKAKEEGKNLNLIKYGDVLVSSTGDGTLGKSCVYRSRVPAIADGHVSIIRVDPKTVYPEYLADYLRCGFGARQIERLYTGSTGLIELTPDSLSTVVLKMGPIRRQKELSRKLRKAEAFYLSATNQLETGLTIATQNFVNAA